ncbi:MAG: acyl-CoA dehydrogenase family protein [Aromatoleum sp.]|jgi:alkylation response protein AidB-like acyl-CoA dehydrogenase|uniref:acyl-CoA dehydrogenase family protein n=1 Tax=Aromatoleum sp. TaxID=2307007 RepID=UPI00289481C6|nr:acyl-CoA dehydrogenase family protein [Aromatoleum sp.]MDT3669900.1 acyl-CoA dehydrogenase family protein [Aromatoleum sp.]
MHLNLTYQQEMVREVARDFMRDKFPKEVRKRLDEGESGHSPEIWQEMAELGWMGLVFPEEYGGAEMGFIELAILLEEMGKVRPVSPFFSTVVLGGLPILDAGSDEQKRAYLPAIAAGEAIWTLALAEESGRYDAAAVAMTATVDGDSYILDGTKLFVPDAHIADYLLCVARTGNGARPEDGITVFIVDTKSDGVRCTPYRTLDNNRLCEVVFSRVRVHAADVLGRAGEGWDLVQALLDKAAVAKCCEMSGGARRVLDMTIEYAKERKQFNRPIGSFQAVQHHCANMLSDVDSSWLISYEAAWRISAGLPHAVEAAMAKAWVSDAYRRVLALGHQVHGGVGLIDEHDLPQYFRSASAAEVAFGDARFHRKQLAQRLGY